MQTWDTPRFGTRFVSGQSPDQILQDRPTLAPHIANYAVRGPVTVNPFDEGFSDPLIEAPSIPSFDEASQSVIPRLISFNYLDSIIPTVTPGDVEKSLRIRTAIFNDLAPKARRIAGQSASLSLEYRRDSFLESVGDLMREPEERLAFMNNINRSVDQSSERVLKGLIKQPKEYDYIVRGGGVAGANVVSTLQETDPDGTILVIDDAVDGSRLGGQFRSYGPVPTFSMNSRIKPVNGIKDVYGLPTHSGDLNSPGMHASLSLPNFVATELATNTDIGDMAAVNLVLSGADFMCLPRNEVTTVPTETGVEAGIIGYKYPVTSRNPVIEAAGAGTIDSKPDTGGVNGFVYSPADVLKMYGEHSAGTNHAGEVFAGKTIALAGCGDTAKVVAKLLVGQGPAEAYRGQRMDRLRPEKIIWIAPGLGGLSTKKAFKAGARAVYSELAAYLPERSGGSSLIEPVEGRVSIDESRLVSAGGLRDGLPQTQIEVAVDTGVYFLDDQVLDRVRADHYIGATGVRKPNFDGQTISNFRLNGRTMRESLMGSEIARTDLFVAGKVLVGACAELGIRSNAGVPENTVSIWATSASVTLAARQLAVRTKARRDETEIPAMPRAREPRFSTSGQGLSEALAARQRRLSLGRQLLKFPEPLPKNTSNELSELRSIRLSKSVLDKIFQDLDFKNKESNFEEQKQQNTTGLSLGRKSPKSTEPLI